MYNFPSPVSTGLVGRGGWTSGGANQPASHVPHQTPGWFKKIRFCSKIAKFGYTEAVVTEAYPQYTTLGAQLYAPSKYSRRIERPGAFFAHNLQVYAGAFLFRGI